MTFGQWFLMQQMQGEAGGSPSGSPTPPPSYFGGPQFDPNQNQGWAEPTPIPNMPGYMLPGDPNLQTGPLYQQVDVGGQGFEPLSGATPLPEDNTYPPGELFGDPVPPFTEPGPLPGTEGGGLPTPPGVEPDVLPAQPVSQYPDGQGGYATLNLGDLPTSNLSDRPPGFYQNPIGAFGVGGQGGTLANEPNIGAGPQPGSLAGLGSFSGGDLGQYGRVVGRNIWDARVPLTQRNYGNLQGYLNYNLGGFVRSGGRPQWIWDASQNRFVKRPPPQGQGMQGGMTYAQYLQEWNALRQAQATGGTTGGGEPGSVQTSNIQGGGRPLTSTQ